MPRENVMHITLWMRGLHEDYRLVPALMGGVRVLERLANILPITIEDSRTEDMP
jgi:hypothetical protein